MFGMKKRVKIGKWHNPDLIIFVAQPILMKPSIPQGTRDFGPDIVRKRQYLMQLMREAFELFGFQPLETPAFEQLETLTGKYGEEGDKLMFKILNNGLERSEKHEKARAALEQVLGGRSSKELTERAMKYDLTIPFARYVAMNHGQLSFPFKRYQMQPVWRADRPQRGRYREFVQCDADIVGSSSLTNEVELIRLYQWVFEKLGLTVQICMNHRKLLSALSGLIGGSRFLTDMTVAIDKLEKVGLEKVMEELRGKGFEEHALRTIEGYLNIAAGAGENAERLVALEHMFHLSTEGMEGVNELRALLQHCPTVDIDVTLARGLNYYTGTIFEVKPVGVQMGSIGGGGRYDNLTGLFGVPNVPGVGISFGVDRIYDVMDELNLFPAEVTGSPLKVMLVNFGPDFEVRNLEVLCFLRERGISCELFPEAIKFDRQLKYANRRGIEWVMLIGEDEMKEGMVSVKDFRNGIQSRVVLEDALHLFR